MRVQRRLRPGVAGGWVPAETALVAYLTEQWPPLRVKSAQRPFQSAQLGGDLGGLQRVVDPAGGDHGVTLSPREGVDVDPGSEVVEQGSQRGGRLAAEKVGGYRGDEGPRRRASQRDAVLTQDPAGVTPVAVVVPFQGAVAVVVEQPPPADVTTETSSAAGA